MWTRAEGSLETQIALRNLAGAGVKYTLVRDRVGILSFSLAVIRSETRAAAMRGAACATDGTDSLGRRAQCGRVGA